MLEKSEHEVVLISGSHGRRNPNDSKPIDCRKTVHRGHSKIERAVRTGSRPSTLSLSRGYQNQPGGQITQKGFSVTPQTSELSSDLMKSFISDYNNGDRREISQYRNGIRSETRKMWKLLPIVCFAGVLVLSSPTGDRVEYPASPIHIIKPPIRCPEGMKPDANGRCRKVWERSIDAACPEGQEPDDEGICREVCYGDDCLEGKRIEKRDVEESEETTEPKRKRTEVLKSEKKSRKRSDGDAKQARSKHAFIMMLKKKKMQMMKPKPPPPPPHHHPPHHSHQQSEEEEEPEEQPAEEPEQPARLFFGDEACIESENSTGGCTTDVETLPVDEAKKDFKEWKPEKSSESSSSSDSTGESESGGDSEESEDEVLEKAIKIKLMKLFRMKQRYGPALRRWLADRLREYEDSFDD